MSTTQIKGLPSGWVWMYKGEETYLNSKGEKSDARHATNIKTGERISVRQVQNIQKQALAEKEQQAKLVQKTSKKKVTVPRTGMIFKKKGVTRKTQKETISYFFRSLEELRFFIENNGIDPKYKQYTIQIKYTSKTKRKSKKEYTETFPDTDPFRASNKNYATLSPFTRREEGFNEEEWIEIYEKSDFYTQNTQTRYIIYATS